MANPDKDEEIAPEQPDPIELLTLKVKKLKKWLMLGGMTSILAVSVLLVTTLVMAFSGQAQPSSELKSIETTLTHFESQIAATRNRSVNTLEIVEKIKAQRERLDVNDEQHSIVKLQKILIRQEQDYRDFLANLQNGMYAMHLMIPHSRSWWEQYEGEIEQSVKLSKARENYVINLRNN